MKKLAAAGAAGLALLLVVIFARACALTTADATPLELTPPTLDRAAIAERLAAALRFQTVSSREPRNLHAEQLNAFYAFLAESFPLVHERLERSTVDDYALVYAWNGTDPSLEPLLLLAHTDVVPVDPESAADWEHPPFSGAIADGFIWGRGALDFKHGVVGILEGAETLLRDGFVPKRSIYFAFGHDEEVLGAGAAAIAERFAGEGKRFALVLDEGMAVTQGIIPGLEMPVALIGLAEKGYATVTLTAETDGGHSSMPPPSTAVGILSRAIVRLEENPLPASLDGAPELLFNTLAPRLGFGPRVLFGNRWLFEGLLIGQLSKANTTNALIRTTTAATTFSGSSQENVLPPRAVAQVNFRIRPGETPESVAAAVRTIIADERVSVTLNPNTSSPSPVSPAKGESFELLRRAIKTTFQEAVVAPSLMLGASDARHYVRVSDNVYRFSPMQVGAEDLPRVHGTNERMAVADYERVVAFYATLMMAFGR